MLTEILLAARGLRKTPAFALTAIGLIAVGLAAATTAFTLVQTLFFKPRHGIAAPAQLYNVHPGRDAGNFGAWSYPDFLATREGVQSFSGLAAFTGTETGLAFGDRSLAAKTTFATANYFDVLGVQPAAGRFFHPDDEKSPGASPVVVISHRLWRAEFNGAPDVVGRTVRVNGTPVTIVGVAPAGFHGTFVGFDMDLWTPLAMARLIGAEGDLSEKNAHWLEVIGRLRPGVAPAAATAEMQQRYTAIGAAVPKPSGYENGGRIFLLPNRPVDDSLRGSALGFAGGLAAIAGLVLLIGSLNVSSLLLTRAEERRRENAVRLAIGCGRARLVRLWLIESVLLFAAGGGLGLLLALWIADLGLFRTPTQFLPLAFDFSLDLQAFGFCFGVALLAGLLTGLIPAARAARTNVVNDLKSGGHTATGSGRLRHALVAAQLALALVPLVAAGLFARTLERAARMAPGFNPDQLLVTTLNLSQLGNVRTQGEATVQRLVEAARAVPGVAGVTVASRMPLGTGSLGTYVKAADTVTPQPDNGTFANLTFVDADYFATLEIPLLAGRAFRPGELAPGQAGPIVLGESLARKLFGTPEAALDRELTRGGSKLRVIGVARDVKYSRLWESSTSQFYLPLAGNPRARVTLAVRTNASAAAVVQPLFQALRAAQPDLPLSPPLPGQEQIKVTLLPQLLGARIATVLGGVCLALAAIGLYSVLALGAVRQQREFGVRIALGAQRSDLIRLVVRRVAWLVTSGTLAGAALAFGLAQLLRGFLHGISPLDPVAYLATAALLALVALLAAWLPARRVAAADPVAALRAE